jgi:hypothetical protein
LGGVLLAMLGGIAMPIVAQTDESQPRFAQVAPSERIPNLDTLKDELKQYLACTCTCGCYAKDLDLQAARAICFFRPEGGATGFEREAGTGARYR